MLLNHKHGLFKLIVQFAKNTYFGPYLLSKTLQNTKKHY